MQYRGDLYGKVAGKYLKLDMTSEDVDRLEAAVNERDLEQFRLTRRDTGDGAVVDAIRKARSALLHSNWNPDRYREELDVIDRVLKEMESAHSVTSNAWARSIRTALSTMSQRVCETCGWWEGARCSNPKPCFDSAALGVFIDFRGWKGKLVSLGAMTHEDK